MERDKYETPIQFDIHIEERVPAISQERDYDN